MKSKLTLITFVVCLLFYNSSFADTFIVTSNGDSGPGSFREALQKAADNGTSGTDTILFSLPNLSRADRTIILDSTLPHLSSRLIIDGTSQNGIPFGISDARVQIENKYLPFTMPTFNFFEAQGINDIQIYGLYLRGRYAGYAIAFNDINNMIFGKPGKGNIVNGFSEAFSTSLNASALPSSNISFQSNLFGIDESGDFADDSTYNNTVFKFLDVFNLLIGGLGNGEGNLICNSAYQMDWNCSGVTDSGYIRIEGNKIGTDRTGLKKLVFKSGAFSFNGFHDGIGDPLGTTKVDVTIIDNISAIGMVLSNFKNYFTIQGNHFGVAADNVTSLNPTYSCLLFFNCGQGLIGGDNPSEKNYIANFEFGSGIYVYNCGNITISKNSLFCNGIGIQIPWLSPSPKPIVTINKITTTEIGGNSLPNAAIELFYDDACPGCEGKNYIGSTTADANGKWIYNGNNTGGIVATATDTYGSTSEFSSATINTDSVEVTDATCGRANGGIKHLRVVSGTDWYWEDGAGNVIARDTDLVNVLPGKYKFVTSIGGNSCKTESSFYEVKNVKQPSIDSSLISMLQPSCGMNNGTLKNNGAFNGAFQYQWTNNANTILLADFSLQNPFINLAPANYYLKLRLRADSTCLVKYGPFTLKNQSGPSINTDNITITDIICNGNKGSIKNITFRNGTGNSYSAWEDSTGKIVGTESDLTGVGKGKYRLKFKDESECDTIRTAFFIIGDVGTITVDTSLMKVNPSSCRGSDGSITNITSENATKFIWTDMASGNVAGNKEDIYGLHAGVYQLELNNSYGCPKIVKSVSVGHSDFLADTVLDVRIKAADCFLDNGALEINRFTMDTSLYTFKWTNSITNEVISTHTSIRNLSVGSYTLTATDTSGCSKVLFNSDIIQIGKPGFDIHALQLSNDVCNSGNGSIQNLWTKDSSQTNIIRSYSWRWYNAEQQEISSSPNELYFIKEGTYYATVTDQFNCTAVSNLFSIINENSIPAKPQANDQYIPRNTTTEITVLNPQKGIYELLHDDITGTLPIASSGTGILQTPVVATDRPFFIRYRDGDCVSALTKVEIKVFDSTIIYVPNAFSPNNDQVNDKFQMTVKGRLKNFHISVYNRFGNMVYSSSDINGYWDGNVKGVLAPEGVFVYVITGITYDDKNIRKKGIVTLLR